MTLKLPKPVSELMAEIITSGMRLRGGDKDDFKKEILQSPEEHFIALLFAIEHDSLEIGSVIDSTLYEAEEHLEKAKAFLKEKKLVK